MNQISTDVLPTMVSIYADLIDGLDLLQKTLEIVTADYQIDTGDAYEQQRVLSK